MKKLSKLLALVLTVAMLIFVLCACGDNPGNLPNNDDTPGTEIGGDTPGGNTPSVNPSKPDAGGGDNPNNPDIGGGDNPSNPDIGGGDNPSKPDAGGGDNPSNPDAGGGDNPSNPDIGGGDNPSKPDAGGGDNPSNPDAGGGETPEIPENATVKGYVDSLTNKGYTVNNITDKTDLQLVNNEFKEEFPVNVTIVKYTSATKQLSPSDIPINVSFYILTNVEEANLWKNYIKENNIEVPGYYLETVDNVAIIWNVKARTDLGLETPGIGGGETPEIPENTTVKGYIDLLTTKGYNITIVDDKAGLESLNTALKNAFPDLNVTIVKYTQATKQLTTGEAPARVSFQALTNAEEATLWKNYIKEHNVDTTGVYYEYVDNIVIAWDIKARTDLGLETPGAGGDNPSKPDTGDETLADVNKMVASLNAKEYPRAAADEEATYKNNIDTGLGFASKKVYCFSKLLAGEVNIIVYDTNANALNAYKAFATNNTLNYINSVMQEKNVVLVGTFNSVCDALGIYNEQVASLYEKAEAKGFAFKEIPQEEQDTYESESNVEIVNVYTVDKNNSAFGLFVFKDNATAQAYYDYIKANDDSTDQYIFNNVVLVGQSSVINQVISGEVEVPFDVDTIVKNIKASGYVEDNSQTLEFRKDIMVAEFGIEPENCILFEKNLVGKTSENSLAIVVCKTVEDAITLYDESISLGYSLPLRRSGRIVLEGTTRSLNLATHPEMTEYELVKDTLKEKGYEFTNATEKELAQYRSESGVNGIVSAYTAQQYYHGHKAGTIVVMSCDTNESAKQLNAFAKASKVVDNFVIIGDEISIEEALDILHGVAIDKESLENYLTKAGYSLNTVNPEEITAYEQQYSIDITDSVLAENTTKQCWVKIFVVIKTTQAKKFFEAEFDTKVPSARLTNLVVVSNTEEGLRDAFDGHIPGKPSPEGPDGPDGGGEVGPGPVDPEVEAQQIVEMVQSNLADTEYNKVEVTEDINNIITKSTAKVAVVLSYENGVKNVQIYRCNESKDATKLAEYIQGTLHNEFVLSYLTIVVAGNSQEALDNAIDGAHNPTPQPEISIPANLEKKGYEITEIPSNEIVTLAKDNNITLVVALTATSTKAAEERYIELYQCTSSDDAEALNLLFEQNPIAGYEQYIPNFYKNTFMVGTALALEDATTFDAPDPGPGPDGPGGETAEQFYLDNLKSKGYIKDTILEDQYNQIVISSKAKVDVCYTATASDESGNKVEIYVCKTEDDAISIHKAFKEAGKKAFIDVKENVFIIANNQKAFEDAVTNVSEPPVTPEMVLAENLKTKGYIVEDSIGSSVFGLAEKNKVKVIFNIKATKLEDYIEIYRFTSSADAKKIRDLISTLAPNPYEQYKIQLIEDFIFIGTAKAIEDSQTANKPEINNNLYEEFSANLKNKGYINDTSINKPDLINQINQQYKVTPTNCDSFNLFNNADEIINSIILIELKDENDAMQLCELIAKQINGQGCVETRGNVVLQGTYRSVNNALHPEITDDVLIYDTLMYKNYTCEANDEEEKQLETDLSINIIESYIATPQDGDAKLITKVYVCESNLDATKLKDSKTNGVVVDNIYIEGTTEAVNAALDNISVPK